MEETFKAIKRRALAIYQEQTELEKSMVWSLIIFGVIALVMCDIMLLITTYRTHLTVFGWLLSFHITPLTVACVHFVRTCAGNYKGAPTKTKRDYGSNPNPPSDKKPAAPPPPSKP